LLDSFGDIIKNSRARPLISSPSFIPKSRNRKEEQELINQSSPQLLQKPVSLKFKFLTIGDFWSYAVQSLIARSLVTSQKLSKLTWRKCLFHFY